METLLLAILQCQKDDLSILSESKADYYEVISRLRDRQMDISLGSVTGEIFEIAKEKFLSSVKERLNSLMAIDIEDMNEEERDELDAIQKLSDSDFSFRFNCLDTDMNIIKNADIYELYFESEIEEFEDYTGFDLKR